MIFEPDDGPMQVPSFIPKRTDWPSESGDSPIGAPDDTAPPTSTGTASAPTVSVSAPLLPDLSPYDLTVGEALEVFTQEQRKRPSDRTLQRYCQDGRFECYKLKTTRNGTPVHEWIINSTSLRVFVRTKPVEVYVDDLAPPSQTGDAADVMVLEKSTENDGNVIATPDQVGDAEQERVLPRSSDTQPDVAATPAQDGGAGTETISRVALLIENANLTARLDAQNELIGELRDDKTFMREQIVHQRRNDSLMSDMHRETLQTLKAVSVAGRHTRIEMPDAASGAPQGSAFYDAHDGEQRPPDNAARGV